MPEQTQPERIPDASPDFRQELLAQLRDVVPEAFADGKLDLERLRALACEAVEGSPERYGLNWPGKREAIAMLQAPSRATLTPAESESVNFDGARHVFIEGENLEVLKLLYRSYFGRVKLIYIDPPYNTGKDFIYPDDFSDPLGAYLRMTGQVSQEGDLLTSKPDVQGRKHSAWLSMMYPRLSLARQFLSDDGAIFISIDGHELQNLILLMDEIFGEENRVDVISVVNNLKGRNDRDNVATCHEYLVIYARKDFSSRGLPLTDEQKALYKEVDLRGEKYALRDLRKRGRPDRREDRPKMFFPVFYDAATKTCSLERRAPTDVEIEPKRGDGSDGRWRWGKQRVEKNLDLLHAKYSKKKDRWDVSHRVYLNPALGPLNGDGEEEDDDDDAVYERTSKSKSFWIGGEISTDVARREFKKLFPEFTTDEYTKSPYFLQRVVQMAAGPSDLVLDFFAGTGTTGQAVIDLNTSTGASRRFIGVQFPQPIDPEDEAAEQGYLNSSEIAFERVRRAAGDAGVEGFRAFRLAASNLRRWSGTPGQTAEAYETQLEAFTDSLEPGWKPEHVLWEVALREGLALSSRVERIGDSEPALFRVTDEGRGRGFTICLADSLTLDAVKALGLTKGDLFVCRATALDDTLAANLALQCRLKVL